jgi:hypothetical protein
MCVQKNKLQARGAKHPKPLDNPEKKRETTPNKAPTEPSFTYGSRVRWAQTLAAKDARAHGRREKII